MAQELPRRGLIVPGAWLQAAIVVFVCGFTVLLYLAYRATVDAPPLPDRVVDPAGRSLFTRADITSGQEEFLRNGLMEYGSIFGHGAYLGPDYTADYLRQAVALAFFCLRYLIPPARWSDRLAGLSFWSLNIGLAWMVFATLFPLGLLQLYASVNEGYWEARSLKFLSNSTNVLIEWLRFPGDVLFIVGGVLPLVWLCWLGVRYRVSKVTREEPEHVLFTEVGEPARVG